MNTKYKIGIRLISGLALLAIVFQNCSRAPQTMGYNSSPSQQDSESLSDSKNSTSKINYNCLNETDPNSVLSKKMEIHSGDVLYCELDLFSKDLAINSLNVDTNTYDRQLPYNLSELKTYGWTEGKMKSGKDGLIYRWRPGFVKKSVYKSIVRASQSSNTILESVEVTYLPPENINILCKVQNSASPLSKNVFIKPGQTLYCELDNYPGITAYTQNLQTMIYDRTTPTDISYYTWTQGKKLNGEIGYVYKYEIGQVSALSKSRAFFFLNLADGNVISEYVDVTFSP